MVPVSALFWGFCLLLGSKFELGNFLGGVSMKRNARVLYPVPKLQCFNQINLLSARNTAFQTWQIGQKKKDEDNSKNVLNVFNIGEFYPMCYGPMENLLYSAIVLHTVRSLCDMQGNAWMSVCSSLRVTRKQVAANTQIAAWAKIQESMELFERTEICGRAASEQRAWKGLQEVTPAKRNSPRC